MGKTVSMPAWNVDGVFERDLRSRGGNADIAFLFRLIARHAWFIDPEIARAVPTVFPRTARGPWGKYHNGEEKGGVSFWRNQPATYAFFAAIGSTDRAFANFDVCHVWPGSTGDPRHFTRLANLVVVPRTLWRFTDWRPVEAVLQRRSFELSGYRGPLSKEPPRPRAYPDPWRQPVAPDDPAAVVERLRRLRTRSPRFKGIPRSTAPRPHLPAPATPHLRWAPTEWIEELQLAGLGRKRLGARDLDHEAWVAWSAQPATLAAFRSWIVRHSYFADTRVAAAVENPFPACRRLSLGAGERQGSVVDGITLVTNDAASDALLTAIQKPLRGTLGGSVDHPWREAPQLPAHFCNLRGLVLVPAALSSLVDAEPMRALLQRQLFERTGYAGPAGKTPPKPQGFPRRWPETVELTPRQVRRAIRMLERDLRNRPWYFRRRA